MNMINWRYDSVSSDKKTSAPKYKKLIILWASLLLKVEGGSHAAIKDLGLGQFYIFGNCML